GGRDLGSADAPIHLVRTRIADGTLPRRDPEKTWFGHGTNRACDACLLPVSREQIEVEADFDGAPTIRLHSSCFHIWQVEGRRSAGRSRRSPAAPLITEPREIAMDPALREKTKKTAHMLFHTLKGGTGFETWKKFDKDLARELSAFFT